MNKNEHDGLKRLLQEAMPRIERHAEPARDLWPGMLRRLDAKEARVPWFDWALIAGLVGMGALFPASIPLLLYYL
jgi:hypothetical protein